MASKNRSSSCARRGADRLDHRAALARRRSASATRARRGSCSRAAAVALLVRLLEPIDDHRGRERQLGVRVAAAPARARARRRRTAPAGRSGSRRDRAARLRAGATAAPASSRSTFSPVSAEIGTMSAKPTSRADSARSRGSSASFGTAVDLVERERRAARATLRRMSIRKRSPPPAARLASTTAATTSTSRSASSAVSTMRTFRRCSGRWTPGVSTNTTCAVGIVADADDAIARGLRLVGDDGELLADQPVEQRGLAGVGPADERDEAALHSAGSAAAAGARS